MLRQGKQTKGADGLVKDTKLVTKDKHLFPKSIRNSSSLQRSQAWGCFTYTASLTFQYVIPCNHCSSLYLDKCTEVIVLVCRACWTFWQHLNNMVAAGYGHHVTITDLRGGGIPSTALPHSILQTATEKKPHTNRCMKFHDNYKPNMHLALNMLCFGQDKAGQHFNQTCIPVFTPAFTIWK